MPDGISTKARQFWQLLRNMGPRYLAFYATWELRRRSGLLAKAFPTDASLFPAEITLEKWRATAPAFGIDGLPAVPPLPESERQRLLAKAERIAAGDIRFFSATWMHLGLDWDWRTHPETDYQYPLAHWTKLQDFSAQAGDIKFVWEKGRFSFAYTLLRAHAHGGPDYAELIFSQIDQFITANPLNLGPQYRCSQEISIRLLAWTYALYVYRHHPALTEARFEAIMASIRGQVHHVRQAIHFSRKAVRNNHSITETALLYLSGLIFPFWPETARYQAQGKAWLEHEVSYQFYKDGGYIQHSFNYQRTATQMLCLTLSMAERHGLSLAPVVSERLGKALDFLLLCQDDASGWLPNYGVNDGALFFPLSQSHYRDYRPALYALASALGKASPYPKAGAWEEEAVWMGLPIVSTYENRQASGGVFADSGYAVARQVEGFTFLRVGVNKDRPGQADNLHLDIWHGGRNLLRDAGVYKYNTDRATLLSFSGTAAHNTCSLGDEDQMQKGPRFIWYYWSKALSAPTLRREDEWDILEGEIEAFGHLGGGPFVHRRTVRAHRNGGWWIVEDRFDNTLGLTLRQHWHPGDGWEGLLSFNAHEADTLNALGAVDTSGVYSSFYGRKQAAPHIYFETGGKGIRTEIRLLKALGLAQYPDQPLDE